MFNYFKIERSFLPQAYVKLYDSITFKIIRILTGILFVFLSYFWCINNKKEILINFYNLIKIYPILAIPFTFIILYIL